MEPRLRRTSGSSRGAIRYRASRGGCGPATPVPLSPFSYGWNTSDSGSRPAAGQPSHGRRSTRCHADHGAFRVRGEAVSTGPGRCGPRGDGSAAADQEVRRRVTAQEVRITRGAGRPRRSGPRYPQQGPSRPRAFRPMSRARKAWRNQAVYPPPAVLGEAGAVSALASPQASLRGFRFYGRSQGDDVWNPRQC
jgi:hypothetical protein